MNETPCTVWTTKLGLGQNSTFNVFCYLLLSIIIIIIIITIIIIIIIIIIIDLTHSKTILENTVGIDPQSVALDFKNVSQYSSSSK